MKWKLTNISRCQSLIGLCPGQSKEVGALTETMKHLYDKQLLSIKQLSDNASPKVELEQPKEGTPVTTEEKVEDDKRKKPNPIIKG